MISKRQKKDVERDILTQFISHPEIQLPATGIDNSETPDFIVNTLDGNLSIEITRLINPNLKEKESFQNKIIQRALEMFKDEFSENLRVHITFCPHYPMQGKMTDIDKYARHISDIVKNVFVNNRLFRFHVKTKKKEILGNHLDEIYIDNLDNFENWQSFGAYLVPQTDFNWVQDKIINKEKNIGRYNQTFKENWLLLVAHFGNESSAFAFDFFNQKEVVTEFDRVYIFQKFANNVTRLK